MTSRRTQAERTAGTRAALVAAARPLFAGRGYAAVGTDELAAAAGVTRGALYHHFGGKQELFVAVFCELQDEIVARLGESAVAAASAADPLGELHANIDAFLAACAEPDMHRILFIEAPAALGWERWRQLGRHYSVGLVELVLQGLIEHDVLDAQPVRPLAHVLVGALEEAATYAARAEDRDAATHDVRAALFTLVGGLVRT